MLKSTKTIFLKTDWFNGYRKGAGQNGKADSPN